MYQHILLAVALQQWDEFSMPWRPVRPPLPWPTGQAHSCRS